jgi:hypothetical protein
LNVTVPPLGTVATLLALAVRALLAYIVPSVVMST